MVKKSLLIYPKIMDYLREEPCPECGKNMEYTGLPDLAGPVKFQFFRCPEHGLIKIFQEKSNTLEQSQEGQDTKPTSTKSD